VPPQVQQGLGHQLAKMLFHRLEFRLG
jgi:hypothetical protein